MTDPRAWLNVRLAEAPESLRERIRTAGAGAAGSRQRAAGAGAFADALKAAAEQLIATPPSPPNPPHAEALNLLTADALMTLACEWVAERVPESLGEFQ